MKVGEVYEVENKEVRNWPVTYVNVRLPNGDLSGPHWAGDGWFEAVEDQLSQTDNRGGGE